MWSAARIARTCASRTTRVAIATATSVNGRPLKHGSKPARRNFCQSPTSIWCSPFRQNFAPSPIRTKPKCTDLLFKATADTLTTIAADPKHLGASIGLTAVMHTWGQRLDHHPHVHCIVPGGGVAPNGERLV